MNKEITEKNEARLARRKEYMRNWRRENRDHIKNYNRQWSEGNEDRRSYMTEYNRKLWADPEFRKLERERKLFAQYRMTENDFNRMWKEQNGNCAICEVPMLPRGKKRFSASIDHNHETGEVRGLLCSRCNKGIGSLRDDPEVLQKAADYLFERGFSKCLKGFEDE